MCRSTCWCWRQCLGKCVRDDAVTKNLVTVRPRCRYIVTHPDRNILLRQELDAFLATAFSPHIVNIEYLQELVVGSAFRLYISCTNEHLVLELHNSSLVFICVAYIWARCLCKALKPPQWPMMHAACHCHGPLWIRGFSTTASYSISSWRCRRTCRACANCVTTILR